MERLENKSNHSYTIATFLYQLPSSVLYTIGPIHLSAQKGQCLNNRKKTKENLKAVENKHLTLTSVRGLELSPCTKELLVSQSSTSLFSSLSVTGCFDVDWSFTDSTMFLSQNIMDCLKQGSSLSSLSSESISESKSFYRSDQKQNPKHLLLLFFYYLMPCFLEKFWTSNWNNDSQEDTAPIKLYIF